MALLLNWLVCVALGITAALAFSHLFFYRAGKAVVRADFDAYRIAQTQALQKAESEYRAKEQAWQESVNQTTKEKDEAIQNIHARLDDALGELRKRPARPASGPVPTSSCNGQGGTGAGIYAEDAGFLVRESARADQLRAALGACYSQYDALTK